jgi:hypothetical protein
MNDLLLVGLKKPIGYLPLDTLSDMNVDLQQLRNNLVAKGLIVLELGEHECDIGSGAFICYDEVALKSLISDHSQILIKEMWPTDPYEFILTCFTKWAEPFTDLDKLIIDAYGNHENRTVV